MPVCHVTKSLFFKELIFIKQVTNKRNKFRIFEVEKASKFEVCPKCAKKCFTIYDHVYVTIRDAPLRGKQVILKIRKRRFKCKNCGAIFREPVDGIRKGFRTTQRFRRHLMFESSNFETLKRVAKANKCSHWLVYKAYFEQIELETRKLQNPWPKTVGIDEHSFIRNKYGHRDFATIFVNYNNKRVQEVVYGRSPAELYTDTNLKKGLLSVGSGLRRINTKLIKKARAQIFVKIFLLENIFKENYSCLLHRLTNFYHFQN